MLSVRWHGVCFGAGQQRTCPPTHRGNCRAEALTAACGSCEETSWCYVVVEGDWTVTSILWPMSKHKLNIYKIMAKENKHKMREKWLTNTYLKRQNVRLLNNCFNT